MEIKVWADFRCPYCYIGKQRLHNALKELGVTARVDVRSYLLNAVDNAPNGQPLSGYVAAEYGKSVSSVLENFRDVQAQARELGLPIDMGKTRYAFLLDAHRVLQYARTVGLGEAFFENAQRALFAEGAVLSDHKTLLRLAGEAGLDRETVKAVLQGGRFRQEALADYREAQQIPLDYVPYYIVDGKWHFSGDLSDEEYTSHLRKAMEGNG